MTFKMTLLTDLDLQLLASLEVVGDVDGEGLCPGQSQGVGGLSPHVLERNNAHPHQVTTVDPLIALRDHRLDALSVV